MKIANVAIVGGTHGNELTGVYLLRRWGSDPDAITRPSFKTNLFLGNPKAVEHNRRFIDEDLNRCFITEKLALTNPRTYESQRAFYLNQIVGPKGKPKHEIIFDLHTSTSNCGVMLILFDLNLFNLRLASYVQGEIPEAKIHYIPPIEEERPYLNSLSPYGLAIEIGPISQGLLRNDVTSLTEVVVKHGLDYLHLLNEGQQPEFPDVIEVFEFQEVVLFPHTREVIMGTIHSSLEGKDYKALHYGEPLFESIDGSVITYDGQETVYPVFINEAGYYKQNVAMSLCVKKTLLTSTGLEPNNTP